MGNSVADAAAPAPQEYRPWAVPWPRPAVVLEKTGLQARLAGTVRRSWCMCPQPLNQRHQCVFGSSPQTREHPQFCARKMKKRLNGRAPKGIFSVAFCMVCTGKTRHGGNLQFSTHPCSASSKQRTHPCRVPMFMGMERHTSQCAFLYQVFFLDR